MGLMDSLRRAEEQGRDAARRSLEKAREGWEDAERRIRRKMRIHPSALRKGKARVAATAPSSIASSLEGTAAGAEPVIPADKDAA
jgi:hypothetical protein